MTTTDANGIIFLEETDNISPFHTLINVLQTGTSSAVGATNTTVTNLDAEMNTVRGTSPVDAGYFDAGWTTLAGAARPKYFKRDGIAFLTSGRVVRVSTAKAFPNNAETEILALPAGFFTPAGTLATAMTNIFVGIDAFIPARISIQPTGFVTLRPQTTLTFDTSAGYVIDIPSMFWIPA